VLADDTLQAEAADMLQQDCRFVMRWHSRNGHFRLSW
jgi:hypothetical protein